MKSKTQKPLKKKSLNFKAILKGLCPACHRGSITHGIFQIHDRCPHCHYDFHPEPGYYLGAMAISFFVTAVLTVPPMVILKILDVDMTLMLAFPFAEFLFVGSFLVYYSRILWLHFAYAMTDKLDGQ